MSRAAMNEILENFFIFGEVFSIFANCFSQRAFLANSLADNLRVLGGVASLRFLSKSSLSALVISPINAPHRLQNWLPGGFDVPHLIQMLLLVNI